MTPLTKTLALVAVAGLLAGGAYLTRPVTGQIGLISDLGQPLTPLLTDTLSIGALEVVSYDDTAAKIRAFKVAFDGKRWTIPSHNNYPADATDKVAAAASAFVDLKKERIESDDKSSHARYGLVAPEEEALAGTPGAIGTRVTLMDTSGKTVCDLIIGKAVGAAPGTPFEPAAVGKKFVREAGKNRVYVTTISSGFSTKFVDWVQTDLLKTTADQITAINIDRYKIDEDKGTLVDRETVDLTKPTIDLQNPSTDPADRKWKLSGTPGGPAKPEESVNESGINELTSTLTALRIVGVRPKPTNLAKILGGTDTSVQLSPMDQISLQSRGFFLSPQGRLLAKDGQLNIRNNDGVYYSLWIGETVPDSEDAASGGRVGGEKPGASSDSAAATKEKKLGDARYLMVTAAFDEQLLPEPKKPAILTGAGPTPVLPTPSGEPAADDEGAYDSPEIATARQKYEAAMNDWKTKRDSGKKRAAELAKRFADWYYVIDAASIAKLKPTRAELLAPDITKPKPVPTPEPEDEPIVVPDPEMVDPGAPK